MNPTFQKKFKVICQDEPYFPKKFQSNLSRCTLLLKKISKLFIEGTLPPKIFQSNLSECTLHPKKIAPKNFKVIRLLKKKFLKKISKKIKKISIFFFPIFFLSHCSFLGNHLPTTFFLGIPQYPGRSTCCKFGNITHGSHSTKKLKLSNIQKIITKIEKLISLLILN